MAVSRAFLEHLVEQLAPLGAITSRRMFSGAGVYCDGLIFALVHDDRLHLKADEETQGKFEAEGLGPFTYMREGNVATLTSYWRAPERLLDEPDELRAWVGLAIGAARRAAARKARHMSKSAKPKARKKSEARNRTGGQAE